MSKDARVHETLSFIRDHSKAVQVLHLNKSFGSDTVLKDINLTLDKGQIHGIIGRNGSGKTVLMKCICGFLRPTNGLVKVFDKAIGHDCDFAPDTGMLIETPGFLPHETGLNNLLWLARIIVLPCAFNDNSKSRMLRTPFLSKPFIGSSRIRREGSSSNAWAMPRRWRMPKLY